MNDSACGKECDHGSPCHLSAEHVLTDRHETEHGCVFFDPRSAPCPVERMRHMPPIQPPVEHVDLMGPPYTKDENKKRPIMSNNIGVREISAIVLVVSVILALTIGVVSAIVCPPEPNEVCPACAAVTTCYDPERIGAFTITGTNEVECDTCGTRMILPMLLYDGRVIESSEATP